MRGILIGMVMAIAVVGFAPVVQAQSKEPRIAGTWRLEEGKVDTDGPRTVIIRADSSASWGEEMVRWRLKDDKIMIALGGEWEIYKIKVRRNRLTLSGPDLRDDVTLKRVGPPTPRPDSIPVPADPDVGS